MATYALVLVLIMSGGSHEYVMDTGLTLADCFESLQAFKNNIAHCEVEL